MNPPYVAPRVLSMLALSLSMTAGVRADFTIEPVPAGAPTGFQQVFSKHVEVLGLHIYASSSTQNSKILHTANILAQWIDNDEDGQPDDAAVHTRLVQLHGSMIMWQTEWEFEQSDAEKIIPDSVWDSTALQLLFGDETNPGYPGNQEFDACLEETLHLMTFGGYSRVYPSVFGEFQGSEVADAMDENIADGWFHYDDPTCDYPCLVTEYTYWALTSLLGAQNYSWRIPEIIDEWELYSASLMQQRDPAMTAILQDPVWNLPTVLPDGDYTPSAPCPGDVTDDQQVNVDDLLRVISDWNDPYTVDDLLSVIAGWGGC